MKRVRDAKQSLLHADAATGRKDAQAVHLRGETFLVGQLSALRGLVGDTTAAGAARTSIKHE